MTSYREQNGSLRSHTENYLVDINYILQQQKGLLFHTVRTDPMFSRIRHFLEACTPVMVPSPTVNFITSNPTLLNIFVIPIVLPFTSLASVFWLMLLIILCSLLLWGLLFALFCACQLVFLCLPGLSLFFSLLEQLDSIVTCQWLPIIVRSDSALWWWLWGIFGLKVGRKDAGHLPGDWSCCHGQGFVALSFCSWHISKRDCCL